MARPPRQNPDTDPVALTEPGESAGHETYDPPENPWMRGLYMLIFALLLALARWVLLAAALLQFLWILFAKDRNSHIAEFGEGLAKWLARATRFQTAATEEKPFPWARWSD